MYGRTPCIYPIISLEMERAAKEGKLDKLNEVHIFVCMCINTYASTLYIHVYVYSFVFGRCMNCYQNLLFFQLQYVKHIQKVCASYVNFESGHCLHTLLCNS